MLVVSVRWFPEYWDGSNTRAEYQIRLEAIAFIISLLGKEKNTAKRRSRKQSLRSPGVC